MPSLHHPGTEWNTPTRQRVLVLRHDCNLSYLEIQNCTGAQRIIVRRTVSSAKPRHNTNPRSGRPQKLTSRDVRRLVRAVTSSKDEIIASYLELAKELEIQASKATIQRILRNASFRCYVAFLKPLIL